LSGLIVANHRKTWIAATAAVVVLALGGCTDQASAHHAEVWNDDRTIALWSSCSDGLTVEFVEDSETVQVTVTDHKRRLPFGSRDDCASGVRIHLAEPLGDRDLIDTVSGELIRIQRNP